MTLSPDGNQLALLSDDSDPHVKLIDVTSGRESRRFKLSDDRINSLQLSFTTDRRLLAAGVIEQRFKLWDLSAKKDQELTRTTKDYSVAKFSNDGRLLALSDNYNIRIWDVASLRELSSLKVPTSGLNTFGDAHVNFSEDGKRIATGGFDTDTIVWETETGKQITNLSGRTNMAGNVSFSADGMQLYSGDRTRWDLRTGRGLRLNSKPPEKSFGTPSPDGRWLALMTLNTGMVSVVETPSGNQVHALAPPANGLVQRVRFSPDSTMLVVIYFPDYTKQQPMNALPSGEVKIWDVKTGRELRSISADNPAEAEFSRDSRTIATIGSMGQISLWDLQSGNKVRDLT